MRSLVRCEHGFNIHGDRELSSWVKQSSTDIHLKRVRKYGFTGALYNIKDFLENARLFGRMKTPVHCLYRILSNNNNKSHHPVLRKRGHTFALPQYTYNSFLPVVFLNVYHSSCVFMFYICAVYAACAYALLTFDE